MIYNTITVHSTFQLHLYVVKLESEQKKNLNYEPLNTFMLFIKLPTLVPPKIYSLWVEMFILYIRIQSLMLRDDPNKKNNELTKKHYMWWVEYFAADSWNYKKLNWMTPSTWFSIVYTTSQSNKHSVLQVSLLLVNRIMRNG